MCAIAQSRFAKHFRQLRWKNEAEDGEFLTPSLVINQRLPFGGGIPVRYAGTKPTGQMGVITLCREVLPYG
jgi:hypothetical protein